MRILTVRQPWAWAIIHGGKDVENRVRNIAGDYRGPVAIHGGLRDDDDAPPALFYERAEWFWKRGHPYPGTLPEVEQGRGAIIGVIDLVDVHDGQCESLHTMAGEILATQPCSPWAEPDTWHLELANPHTLPDPIPYKGALGLRHLDADTIARIEEAIA